MTGDCHVRFGERLAGKFRRSTHLDFKIQLKNTDGTFSKSRMLKELKQFRTLKWLYF